MRFTIALENNNNDEDKAREATPMMQSLTTMTERDEGGGQWGWLGGGGVGERNSMRCKIEDFKRVARWRMPGTNQTYFGQTAMPSFIGLQLVEGQQSVYYNCDSSQSAENKTKSPN